MSRITEMCHGLNPFHTNNLTDGFVPMVNVMKVMNLKNCDKRLLWVEEKMNERRNFFCRNIQMHFIKKDNPKFYIQHHHTAENFTIAFQFPRDRVIEF